MNYGNHPAFPCEAQGDRNVPAEHDYLQTGIHAGKFPGIMMRDYFAGKALAGICAHVDTWGLSISSIADAAYQLADAMLAARAEGGAA